MFIAMDDGNGCAPITLAADAPIAQTPSGFFLAQTFGGELFCHLVDSGFECEAI